MGTRSWMLLIAVGLGVMLNPLNSSMVSVAMPSIQQTFGLDFTTVSWIIFAFYLSSAAAQPIMGKISDGIGRRRIFLIGLAVSIIASFAAALSPDFAWLIGLRILQSIGTSMMIAVGMAIVRVHITEKQGSALAVLSVFLSGAAAIGPFAGGLLIHAWDWRAVFMVNVPVAGAALLLAWRVLPQDAPQAKPDAYPLRWAWLKRIDPIGILLFLSGLTMLMLGLLTSASSGRISVGSAGLGLAGIGLLVFLVRHEWRHTSPFIPVRVFVRYPALIRVNLEFLGVNILFYSIFFGLPSYLQQVRGVNELYTGWLMLSLGLCSLLAAPFAGRWVDRFGSRPVIRASALLMALASLGLLGIGPHSSLLGFIPILAAFGLANGLNGVAMQAALFEHSPVEIVGVASGLFNTSRYLGTILSSLLLAVLMGGTFTHEGLGWLGFILLLIALRLTWTGKSGNGRKSRLPNP
ncbi:MFS transporter [Saccharibacillus qingshengii]|uniref:MFS transporter n=1 Tax=Saccharibacillus qingshengii TaxID=1763540 RepID=UPI001552A488|nr:MFS transporter [Saccharibacillus qingshengii]